MIEFVNVHKTYSSGVEALKGVSFEIQDGEFVFIIGKSGSGKSTLMKCITCEEVPTEGSVYIDDFSISRMSRKLVPDLRRQLGMIYQDFRLIKSKTVFENIAFAGEIIGVRKKELDQIVQLVLNSVGLKDKADAYPQELSGGEQQRVAIARAMVNNPKLIVADEPTGNLDPETSESIMALLQEINRSGATVIVSTHDSNLVDRMKKRVLEIEDGLVVRDQQGSKYSTENTPVPARQPEVRNTIVDASMNIAFGDDPAFLHDRDYNAGFDDEEYIKNASAASFYFGDEQAPAPATVPAAAPEEGGALSVAIEEETGGISKTSETPEAGAMDEPEVIGETGVIDEAGEIAETVETETSSQSLLSEQEPTDAIESRMAEDDLLSASDDSWIREISLDDIDLDIQEDD